MTITHVDRDHLADLEFAVTTLTVRCAALELELAAIKVAHEAELRETRDLLAAYRVTAATQQEWIERRNGVERRQRNAYTDAQAIIMRREGAERRQS